MGKDNENGARMAIEELNAANLTINGAPAKFELLAEDDAADPKQGTAAAQKLVDAKVAGVIGHLNSGTTIPASQIYNDAGIPQISPSATNRNTPVRAYPELPSVWWLMMCTSVARLASTPSRVSKAKNVAVIDDRTAYGQGVADEFEKGVVAAGGTVVGREFTNDKATDFNAILTTLKAKKPDVKFFGGMDAVAGPMLKQMKQLGIEAKFMGGDGICSAQLPTLAGDGLSDDQVYCAEAGGVEGEEKVGMDKFREDFRVSLARGAGLCSLRL
ncbi:MAG: branched-chain amino acid ABC transporter substrate-binding protein [Burkholderiaceae bacterium]